MRIFLDTANIDQIRQAAKLGVIGGVTTNPSLVSKEGTTDYEATIKEISSIIPGPISTEVLVQGVEPMIEQARQISTWAPNLVIKIPATAEGLEVTSELVTSDFASNFFMGEVDSKLPQDKERLLMSIDRALADWWERGEPKRNPFLGGLSQSAAEPIK